MLMMITTGREPKEWLLGRHDTAERYGQMIAGVPHPYAQAVNSRLTPPLPSPKKRPSHLSVVN
ncbi:hypothetical protein [Faunimonas pinastri]|uniref:hypothetical protein n=1 Tax=Faunimonas pinastri TaxID=1855383 RepID=UPI00115FEB54|nr:hypothetical protein [Faunimonas pinastri]